MARGEPVMQETRNETRDTKHETKSRISLVSRLSCLVSALGLAVAALLSSGCHQQETPKPKAVEVVVTTPITDTVTDYQDFTGRLDAVKTVDVRARVSGYVNEAPF